MKMLIWVLILTTAGAVAIGFVVKQQYEDHYKPQPDHSFEKVAPLQGIFRPEPFGGRRE